MQKRVWWFSVLIFLMVSCSLTALYAEDKAANNPVSNFDRLQSFWRSGLPMSEWMSFFHSDLLQKEENGEEEDGDGVEPAPGYVPPEVFVPGAIKPVQLDGAIGPNTLVNSRELCNGRGITQSETSIAVDGDTIVVAFNDARGFYCPNRSTLGWAYSFDGGQTFTDGGTLPGGRGWSNGDPSVVVDKDGVFYVSGIANNYNSMYVSRGTVDKNGITWDPPVAAVRPGGLIDKELLLTDETGRLYMAYGRSQSLEVIYSDDGNTTTWSNPVRVGSGIGVFPILGANGKLHVAWLSGWPGPNQNMNIATSDDRGETFGAPVLISRVCPYNVLGFSRGQIPAFPSVAVDKSGGPRNGRIYVTWHSNCDRSAGDAMLSWSADDGATWSEPVIVNDDDGSGLHASPSVSLDTNGNVNVVFYDRRENPGTGITNVYFAQSRDGGATFQRNIRVTDVATNWSSTRSDITPNFGDYMQSLSVGTDVLLTWADGREGDPDAYFARIKTDRLGEE